MRATWIRFCVTSLVFVTATSPLFGAGSGVLEAEDTACDARVTEAITTLEALSLPEAVDQSRRDQLLREIRAARQERSQAEREKADADRDLLRMTSDQAKLAAAADVLDCRNDCLASQVRDEASALLCPIECSRQTQAYWLKMIGKLTCALRPVCEFGREVGKSHATPGDTGSRLESFMRKIQQAREDCRKTLDDNR